MRRREKGRAALPRCGMRANCRPSSQGPEADRRSSRVPNRSSPQAEPGGWARSGRWEIHSRRERSEERRVGKSVSVRVDLGGRRIIKKKKKEAQQNKKKQYHNIEYKDVHKRTKYKYVHKIRNKRK